MYIICFFTIVAICVQQVGIGVCWLLPLLVPESLQPATQGTEMSHREKIFVPENSSLLVPKLQNSKDIYNPLPTPLFSFWEGGGGEGSTLDSNLINREYATCQPSGTHTHTLTHINTRISYSDLRIQSDTNTH